ncbi:MAG TPA: hypothetical protein VIJ51_02505 [Solirubrobacteraceae bacterium]
MPFGIGKKRSKPQAQQQQQQSAPAPATAPPPPSVPADFVASLHAAGPKGRFVQGENIGQGYRR